MSLSGGSSLLSSLVVEDSVELMGKSSSVVLLVLENGSSLLCSISSSCQGLESSLEEGLSLIVLSSRNESSHCFNSSLETSENPVVKSSLVSEVVSSLSSMEGSPGVVHSSEVLVEVSSVANTLVLVGSSLISDRSSKESMSFSVESLTSSGVDSSSLSMML